MKASRAAIELIKRFESLQLDAYLCPAGVWTIGWGHTAGVEPGMRITRSTPKNCSAWISKKSSAARIGDSCAADPGQTDALVSLCFNLRGGPRQLPRWRPSW